MLKKGLRSSIVVQSVVLINTGNNSNMKRTLTALTVAALLAPLSANAESKRMTGEKSEEIMVYGEVIGVNQTGTAFIIKYKKSIFKCYALSVSGKTFWVKCLSTDPNMG